MIYVVAGDHKQFVNWCKYNNIAPNNPKVVDLGNVVEKGSKGRRFSLDEDAVVFVGNGYYRENIGDVITALRSIGWNGEIG